MADALALTFSLAALVVAVLAWRRQARPDTALAEPPGDVQSQSETEPDRSAEWERFLNSPDRERFERALRNGTEVM